MTRPLRPLLAAVGLLVLLAAPLAAGLPESINSLLEGKYARQLDAGVAIVELGAAPAERRVLFTHQGDKTLIPASNLKVVTTAAALAKFGADFRFRTVLASRTLPDGSVELALVGDGDPTLGDLRRLAGTGWDIDTVFKQWAAALLQAGVTKVDRLLIDDSVFDEEFLHPSWPADQELDHYVAQVGGINLNANCIWFDIRPGGGGEAVSFSTRPATQFVSVRNAATTGGNNAIWFTRDRGTNQITLRGTANASLAGQRVTIHDPAMFAGTVLAESLVAGGIPLAGAATRDRSVRDAIRSGQGGWRVLAIYETPLPQVLAWTNKESVNMYAESLCKRLGFVSTGASGSWAGGTAAMGEYLRSLGVQADQFSFDDGCGLSRKNLITPNALLRVLEDGYHSASQSVYVNSMAIGGVDGTLDRRFDGAMKGRVFGKSGYINGVVTLSGYLRTRDDRWVAFAILLNGVPQGTASTARKLQEQILEAVDAEYAAAATTNTTTRP